MARWIVFAGCLLSVASVRAQEGGDLQAQILYAFQTEDANRLAGLIQMLNTEVKTDGANASLRYHLAHAQYRAGQLFHERRSSQAAEAFSECIDDLKPLLEISPTSPEVLALQSGCYAELAELKSLEAVVLRARAVERLKSAMLLEPNNPRVVLMDALQDMRRGKPGSIERQRAFAELQRAARLFEDSPGTNDESPGWGHAETYLAVGRELQIRHDQLGARNWIEKSLLAAPDYKAAQRQLAILTK